MIPEALLPQRVTLDVVSHEEYREIAEEIDATGEKTLVPVPGTETAYLHLRLASGKIIRAQIPPEDLDEIIVHMFPNG